VRKGAQVHIRQFQTMTIEIAETGVGQSKNADGRL